MGREWGRGGGGGEPERVRERGGGKRAGEKEVEILFRFSAPLPPLPIATCHFFPFSHLVSESFRGRSNGNQFLETGRVERREGKRGGCCYLST